MAAGQTNAQIARSIGFSESTVRQETMGIYRHLGANGRHDATRLAAERGMIQGARMDDSLFSAQVP
jgi:DNA-binding NarL/FixJ family response regulator